MGLCLSRENSKIQPTAKRESCRGVCPVCLSNLQLSQMLYLHHGVSITCKDNKHFVCFSDLRPELCHYSSSKCLKEIIKTMA